jgi:hypothetical protein
MSVVLYTSFLYTNDVSMSVFYPVYPTDVETAIARLPTKSSSIDPFQVTVLKLIVADLISPLLAHFFNQPFLLGSFPCFFKVVSLTPILRKPGLPSSDPVSHRFLSSLSFWNVSLLSNLFPIFPFTNFFLPTNPAYRILY